MNEKLLSTADVARRLSISQRTAARLVNRGAIRGLRVGRVIRVTPEALAAFEAAGGSRD
jgi:excisionase family DNA binding protein